LFGTTRKEDKMKMLEEGIFKARARDWKLGVTSNGKEQVAVAFRLEDGRTITWYGYFTDKTLDRTVETLRICGWDGNDPRDLTGLDRNEVALVIEHERDAVGQVRARVRWVNRPGGAQVKEELSGAALDRFADRLRGAIATRRTQAEDDTSFSFGANTQQRRSS
jgi:hypothetical protein